MSLQSIVGVVIQVKFNSKHVENSLINFALQKRLSLKHQGDLESSALLGIYVLYLVSMYSLFGIFTLCFVTMYSLFGIYALCLVSMYSCLVSTLLWSDNKSWTPRSIIAQFIQKHFSFPLFLFWSKYFQLFFPILSFSNLIWRSQYFFLKF